ncbi:MAG: hypothetical protein ACRCXL_12120 [Dermatophilaceae bacterium]
MSTTSAGWYPQPDGTERYWTGSAWTDDPRSGATHSGAMVPVPPAQYAPPPLPPAPAAPQSGGAVYAPVVAPKNPGLSLLGSFFLPGLGQFINGHGGKGVLMLAGWIFSFLLMFVLIGFVTAPVVWIWSMVDAYTSAQRWNLDRGIIS